jgi:hypothetical protein
MFPSQAVGAPARLPGPGLAGRWPGVTSHGHWHGHGALRRGSAPHPVPGPGPGRPDPRPGGHFKSPWPPRSLGGTAAFGLGA